MPTPIRQVLDDARNLLRQHPDLGRSQTVVRATSSGPVGATVRAGSFTFEADEPEVAGGLGSAPSPVQYALGALAACEVVTFRYWAVLLDTPFDEIEVDVRAAGDISGFLGFDPAAPAGLSEVSVTVRIRGTSERARYEDLHAAVRAHCPVLLAFANGMALTTELVVLDTCAGGRG